MPTTRPTTPAIDALDAFETMVRGALSDHPQLTLVRVQLKPYHRSTALRAVAVLVGPSDSTTVVSLSEDLNELTSAGLPGGLAFAGRIEVQPTGSGFELSVDFDVPVPVRMTGDEAA